jgi:MFS family permease
MPQPVEDHLSDHWERHTNGWVAVDACGSYASIVVRSWVKLIWNSLGVAVVAAAAQLGVAEALGVVRWTNHYEPTGGNSWNAVLTWIVFIYAVAVLSGCAVGRHAVQRPGRPEGIIGRAIAALAAAVGAALAVSLAALQARTAVPPVNVHPELVVLVMGLAGVVAGLVVAAFALFVSAVAGSVRAYVVWVWLAAIVSSVAGILTHRPYPAPRLSVIDTNYLNNQSWWPGVYVMIAAAAVLAFGVALVARWAGAHRVAVAVSGLFGPAIVAGAYGIARPDFHDLAFLSSLYGVGAGLVAAAVVAIPSRAEAREETGPADPMWGDADRYRPGNYLAESRPADIVSPFRTQPSRAEAAAASAYPAAQAYASTPEPARADAQTYASAGYGSPELDYPTDEYPTTTSMPVVAPASGSQAAMGQPAQSFGDSGSEWLRSLGSSAQRG